MSNWMHTRQTKYTAYVTIYIIVIVGVLGVANWLASRHPQTFDVTANKRFSLADQTQKVVKGLTKDVKVTYFDRERSFQRAKDLLNQYDALSTKFIVEYVDPDKNPQKARAFGARISPGTVYIDVGAKREEARSLTEEEVTSALIRALKTGERNVCAVAGSGEHSFDDTQRSGMSGLKQFLEKNNYKTRTIKLIEKPEIPADCTVLVVAGPRFDYLPPAVEAIKKYFTDGGKVLIALDPPLAAGKEGTSNNEPLQKLLEEWGVTMQKNLVLDLSGIGQALGISAAVALVTNYEGHMIVRDLKEVATGFPLARSLDVKAVTNMTPEKLFGTGANSLATENLSSPEIRPNPEKDKKGPFTLAAAGSMNSGNPDDKKKPRFVAVGNSGFLSNSFLGFQGNGDLTMNMFNWLSADEDLISIRPKDPQDRRLNITGRQMSMILYSSVVFLPLIAAGLGLMVYMKRR